MKSPFQDVIDLVNATLDGRDLLDRLREAFVSPAAFESDFDCQCLFEPGAEGIPLRLDIVTNTCSCSRQWCPASDRNSMVELYAFARGRDTVSAALELAEIYDLEVDEDRLHEIESHYLMLTQEALLLENVGMAGRCFLTALLVCPSVDLARERVCSMTGQLDRVEDGAEFYLQFASYLEMKGEIEEAYRVLKEEVLELHPYRPEYQARFAALQKKLEPESNAWAGTLLRVCDTLIVDGKFEAAQRCLVRAQKVLPLSAQIRERMAETYRGMEMDLEASQETIAACDLYEQDGEYRLALKLLEVLVRENPGEAEYRKRSAEVRLKLRDREGYARDIEAMARAAMEGGREKEALALLEDAVEKAPEHLYIRETLADIYRRQLRTDECAQQFLASIDILLDTELFDRALENLESARKCGARNPDLLRQMAEKMARLGQLDQAADEFFSLGSTLLMVGEEHGGADLLERISEFVPLDEERIRRACRELDKRGHGDIGNRLLLAHARALSDYGESEAGRTVLSEIAQRGGEAGDSFDLEEEITLRIEGEEGLRTLVLGRLDLPMEDALKEQARTRVFTFLEKHPADSEALQILQAHLTNEGESRRILPLLLRKAENESVPLDERIEAAERALEMGGQDPDALAILGGLFALGGDSLKAARTLSRASRAYLDKGIPERASATNSKAFGFEVDIPEIMECIAENFDDLNARKQAEEAWDRLLVHRMEEYEPVDLEEIFSKVTSRYPEGLSLHLKWVDWLVDRDRTEEATKAISVYTTKSFAENRIEDAESGVRRWLQLAPKDVEALALLWQVRAGVEPGEITGDTFVNFAEAVRNSDAWELGLTAITTIGDKETPPRDVLLLELECLAGVGRTDEAEKRALELLPDAGDAAAELPIRRILANAKPENHVYTHELAGLLLQMGQRDEALQLLRTAAQTAPPEFRGELLTWIVDISPNSTPDLEPLLRLEIDRENFSEASRLRELLLRAYFDSLEPLEFSKTGSGIPALADDPAAGSLFAELLAEKGLTDEAVDFALGVAGALESSGEMETALTLLRRTVDWAPFNTKNLERLAALEDHQGNHEQAVGCWRSIADIYARSGDKGPECDACGSLLKLDPANRDIMERRAVLLRHLGERERAVALFLELGSLLTDRKYLDDRVRVYTMAVDAAPADRSSLEGLIAALEEVGRGEETIGLRVTLGGLITSAEGPAHGIPFAEESRKLHPEAKELRSLLIDLYIQNRDWTSLARESGDLAKMHIDANDQNDAIVLLKNSLIPLLEAKEHRLVLEVLTRFPELLERSPNLLRFQALAYEGLGQRAEALVAWVAMADLHAIGNRAEEEETALRRALAVDSQNIELRRRLIAVLRKDEERNLIAIVHEYRDLAASLQNESDGEELEEVWREILRIDHEDLGALESLAVHFRTLGRNADSLEMYIRLGQAASTMENREVSLQAFHAALGLDEWNVDALRGLCRLYRAEGDTERLQETSLQLARVLDQQGEEEESLAVWQEVAAMDPSNLESRIRLADLFLGRGNKEKAIFLLREIVGLSDGDSSPEEAIDMLHRLLELEPDDPLALEQIGLAYLRSRNKRRALRYLRRAAELLVNERDTESAAAITSQLIELDPEDTELLAMHAELLIELGHNREASEMFEKMAEKPSDGTGTGHREKVLARAVSLDPENLSAREKYARELDRAGNGEESARQYLEISRSRASQENIARAIGAAETAAVMNPSDPDVKIRLGELYARKGDRAESAAAYLWLARNRFESGERDQAREYLDLAIAQEPTAEMMFFSGVVEENGGDEELSVKHYLKAAELAEKVGETDLYREALQGAVRQYPANTDILRKICLYLRAQGEFEAATDLYIRGMEHTLEEGDIPMSRHLMAEAGEIVGPSKHLRRRAAQLYRLHEVPELAARAHVDLARELYREGLDAEALEQVQKALELQPTDLVAHQTQFTLARRLRRETESEAAGLALSKLYSDIERFEEALEVLKQILDDLPNSIPALDRLADIQETAGQTDEAIATIERLAGVCENEQRWAEATVSRTRQIALKPEDMELRKRRLAVADAAGMRDLVREDCLVLGDLLVAEEKYEEAEQYLGRLEEEEPDREDVQRRLIDVRLRQGEIGPAVAMSYKLARACLDKNAGPAALTILDRVREHIRDDPEFHLLTGAVHHMAKSRGLASREYRRALELYRRRRDRDQEAFLLSRLLELDPMSLEIRQMQVDLLLESGSGPETLEAMEALANTYRDRKLHDLAEAEYRRILSLNPEKWELWRHVFDAHVETGTDADTVEELLHYANMLAKHDRHKEAVDYYRRIAIVDPTNVRARSGYVKSYGKIGHQAEIIDDILELAQLLVDSGRIDEGIEFFELATSADPKNKKAQHMLSATQARSGTEMRRRLAAGPDGDPIVDPSILDDLDLSHTQLHMVHEKISPGDLLKGTIDEMDRKENQTTLQHIAEEYEDMLAMNPANSDLRMKLADVYQQMNRISEMLQELDAASEALFKKGDLSKCLSACEKYLEVRPDSAKVRRRLNDALLKRDAFRALESAILFDDDPPPDSEKPRRR